MALAYFFKLIKDGCGQFKCYGYNNIDVIIDLFSLCTAL